MPLSKYGLLRFTVPSETADYSYRRMKHIRVIASGLAAATLFIGGAAFAQSAAFSSQMGVGAQGSQVTSLQTWLQHNGYYTGPITGYYGSLTRAGVMNFQSANSISATGYVGPITLAALNAKASDSSTVDKAALILQLQAQLNALLAQIQTLQSHMSSGAPTGANMTLATNVGVGVNGTLGVTGTGPFTYTLATNPINGTVTAFNTTTGAFTYTPNSNFNGSDTFTYTVRNAAGVSSPMTITVNVGSVGGAPTGRALSFSTSNGVAYNGSLGATGNSPYTFSITGSPTHGSISNFNSSTGAFTYTPTANYSGSDTFTYTVSNSAGVSSPVTVTVNNGTSSGAPTGQNLSFTSQNGVAINGQLTATGSGPYTYTLVNSPTHGTFSGFSSANGSFSYIPNTGYTGSDSFTYTVGNGTATSSAYTVSITD